MREIFVLVRMLPRHKLVQSVFILEFFRNSYIFMFAWIVKYEQVSYGL